MSRLAVRVVERRTSVRAALALRWPKPWPRTVRACLVAFALRHLPTLLMGGQYPGRAWCVAVPAMVVSCVLVLPVFTWLRLRSGPVVPAVIGRAFSSTVSVATVYERSLPSATATTSTRVSGLVARQRWRTPPVR
ncbi:hypothetical protein OG897_34015 [Streptomyces sp. NBC_00237]|uniref:hypothetical protein n=1 Tax=Streptomyces sp. NBC_00237 TaxID=2975687 RepID=UPI0022534BF5|nr:hypothetical protein [Streptomyces sp. NBC_00237]MCX5206412.1 hypothetical protein [Streptomyces sp. NBC_00237]